MKIEVMLSSFDATVADIRRAAHQADDQGISGLWVMDHLNGKVHAGRRTVLECLATLGVLAEATSTARIGSLVLNAVSRQPVVLAQALATLHQVANGRLVVGLGAGGGGGDYGRELASVGLIDHPAAVRRQRLAETAEALRCAWDRPSRPFVGDLVRFEGGEGFLSPVPRPPLIFGGYGPRMATLAGEVADGFNTNATHPDLAQLMAQARGLASGRSFETSVFALYGSRWIDPDSDERRRLVDAGIDTLVIVTEAPHHEQVITDIARAADAAR